MTVNGTLLPPLHPPHPRPPPRLHRFPPPFHRHQNPMTTANGIHHILRGMALHFASVPHTKTTTTSLPQPRHNSLRPLFNTHVPLSSPLLFFNCSLLFLFFIQSHFTWHNNRRDGEGNNCTDRQTLARQPKWDGN